MIRYTLIFVFIFASLLVQNLGAQNPSTQNPYKISGRVLEKESDKPLEYATVTLLRQSDSSMVSGATTNLRGDFLIQTNESGDFILRIGFIGYARHYEEIQVAPGSEEIQVGEIKLALSAETFDEVNIVANRHGVEYKIDKKVVHVSEQFSAISGNAVDVLENVPSIQVDIEGNVSLRGNSNFTVLIDDRPTVLDANEALQQIPASMIEDIEIITNPSAKYDPEGTAGIINIVTKKKRLTGLNGIAHLNLGLDDKYGSDLLLNYRSEKFNLFVGGDYNKRNYPGNVEEKNRSYQHDTTFYLNSDGGYQRKRESYSARAGVEWFPRENITLSLSGRYGGRSMEGLSNTTFREWTSLEPVKRIYSSDEDWNRGGDFYSIRSEYTHLFGDREHKLDMHLMLYNREGDEESINTLRDTTGEINNSQRSTEAGPSQGVHYRLNYKRPLNSILKMEAGAQGRIRKSEEDNHVYYYNTATGNYELQEAFSHDVQYSRSIHALYGLVMGELGDFGFQLGLRGEYTFRHIELLDTKEDFNINRWDYFPTVHTSYKLPNDNQLMASYSRRIDRPRGWYLEPFITWSDAYNVRRGNPGIQPEYIDSWELGYQKSFGDNSISIEGYYRKTKNRIERIRSVYEENIILRTFENVGTDYALGTEVMLNLVPLKWWEANLTGNFYDYRVEGQLNDVSFDKRSFTWSVRWNNILNITKKTRIQLNPAYHSPEVEAQEKEEGYFVMHAALRQVIFEEHLNATLQVRDVFSTAKHESEIEGADFYNYRLYTHKSPIVMLNVTWRINNYRENNGRGMNGANGDFGGEGEM
ncbi:MAG: TonB-dependent receptor family protein [Bacteroidales bacterium]|nr:TonB-dependent receptor family protein [Bacteroidales bacterium]MCF8398461.1 TonB-dependent receptor family protein [Bacteroidales bacterium]